MLTYDKLPEKIKTYFRRNITMSVAFVKKDGSIRHMSFRRNLKSYVKSDTEKTEAQMNKLQNNNLMLVYDTNLYIKAMKSGLDEAEASKMSFRNFKLENVLAFLCGGELFDMRKENDIMGRFGEETASQLTKSMVSAMSSEESDSEKLDDIIAENRANILKKYIIQEVTNLHKKTLLKEHFVSPVKLADELVAQGVIKDEFTDLSGRKASSHLAFIVNNTMEKIREKETPGDLSESDETFGLLSPKLRGKDVYTKEEVQTILRELAKKIDISGNYRIYDLERFLGIHEED